MLGVLVNVATVLVGSAVGLLAKKAIPEKVNEFVMTALALCVLYIGIDGSLAGENTLITIISMVVGAIIGMLLDLDRHLNNMASKLEARFNGGEGKATIAEGFVTASLLFCVGAMTIVGSLQAGLTGDNTMLFTKATLDAVSSVILAATLGFGVMLSAGFVLVFQGTIVLLAQFAAPFLSDAAIAEMTCAGSLLIIAMGLNMLKITNIKVMNLVPAIFIPIILCTFM